MLVPTSGQRFETTASISRRLATGVSSSCDGSGARARPRILVRSTTESSTPANTSRSPPCSRSRGDDGRDLFAGALDPREEQSGQMPQAGFFDALADQRAVGEHHHLDRVFAGIVVRGDGRTAIGQQPLAEDHEVRDAGDGARHADPGEVEHVHAGLAVLDRAGLARSGWCWCRRACRRRRTSRRRPSACRASTG